MKVNFNLIAPIYDLLSSLVYGKELIRAQVEFLNKIPKKSKVLVIGGGTGKFLESLDKLGRAMDLVYLEASSSMLKRAKSRAPFENLSIDFQLGTQEDIKGDFDVIITFFFLDLFTEASLKVISTSLYKHLKKEGIWLFADFCKTETFWQQWLVKIMYTFFRVVSGIEASHLLNLPQHLSNLPLAQLQQKHFFHGMVASYVFRKS
ncbi:class I SAM-dependent methyltransferase [Fulvivirga maritima]|uniref:class I SAM-dependent methyltransferase n=1 Tax=Fulvivirga maritima TaxID=2904247 RepID=UPI001F3BB955|nr:class I SAM-dependent methyltransferase [Fulvivirga maritima]UII28510.1 class I SAM-dependent methyltransferase [Fulvivirga maritima]